MFSGKIDPRLSSHSPQPPSMSRPALPVHLFLALVVSQNTLQVAAQTVDNDERSGAHLGTRAASGILLGEPSQSVASCLNPWLRWAQSRANENPQPSSGYAFSSGSACASPSGESDGDGWLLPPRPCTSPPSGEALQDRESCYHRLSLRSMGALRMGSGSGIGTKDLDRIRW